MHYSAATAPLSIGGAVFIVPHLIFGTVFLGFAMFGKCILAGSKSKFGLLLQVPVGALFLWLGVTSLYSNVQATLLCRGAEQRGDYEVLSGSVTIIKRFEKPTAGYVQFTIGEREFMTQESAARTDCGYIRPLGYDTVLKDGMNVEAKVYKSAIIALRMK